ncbi:MAG: hypothetical protein M1827_002916 [Pycnora praestabilis]|nr:MAG: hypothetical protein M1827_002916 [Pycnora praestabilis]
MVIWRCRAVLRGFQARTRQLRRVPAIPQQLVRKLHTSSPCYTDGVYRALTDQRVKVPWVEALRKQREEGYDPTKASCKPATPANRKLEPKKMSDSYHRVVLPLAQDPWLLDSYLNASGHIRFGTIFMDLDALSGVVAYKHTGDHVTTVTAAVDRITINHPLREICDLELSGQVTYATGRSSMEVSVQVAKAPGEGQKVKKEDILMTCAFTMINHGRPVAISPLQVENPEERRLYDLGEKNSKQKKRLAKTALLKQTPNDEESDLIHAMWIKQLDYHNPNLPIRKPENVIYMDLTKVQSTQIMQPQYRNRHNFMIFGGFLLKQTFELAFCCVASFSHTRPTFVSLDPSTFENPVPVGSVLYLTATIAYTDPPVSANPDGEEKASKYTRVQVRVDTKVRNIEHGETKPTGQFSYTFTVERDIKVMPRTYSEFMIWVDARRRGERVTATLGEHDGGISSEGSDDGKKERVTE